MVQPFRNLEKQRELLLKRSSPIVKGGKVLKPKSVMVWADISRLGKRKLVFASKEVKIDIKTYQELIVKGAVTPWAERKARNIDWQL